MMIIDAFEKCVELHPNNIAIKFQGENISYKRLNEVANSIGYVIKETVNENKVVVGLYFEQGIDMIYSTIAALKANVIYVPIETDNPEGRLKYIIDDSEMTLIITNTANYENLQRLLSTTHENLKIINIDEISSNVNAVNLMRKKVANDTAYIMYTSGSTGRPKGVMQSNKNVMYFIEEYTKLLSITSEDNMTLISSFGHDAAIMDIYSALLNGATLFPIEIKKVDAKRISDLILDEKLTIFHSVPTIYRYVVDDLIALGSINKLKYIVLGGESVRLDDVDRITNTSSDVKLINLYGQTESSFNSAMIYDKNSKVNNISLGDPISKTELIVVNENREEVLPLEIGEIVVVSEHVALGFCGKDQNDDLKPFDFGLYPAAGIRFGNFEVGVSYKMGLANIAVYTEDGYTIKNNVIGVNFRFWFGD